MRFHVTNAPGTPAAQSLGMALVSAAPQGAFGPGPRISAMGPSHRLRGPSHGSQESSPHKGEGWLPLHHLI